MTHSTRHLLIAAAAASLFVVSPDAWALHCNSRIVGEGMDEATVIRLCGEPVWRRDLGVVFRPHIVKQPVGKFGSRSVRRVYGGFHEQLVVSEMLFNFGPRRLMRLMRFEGGRVTRIETAGYGYVE